MDIRTHDAVNRDLCGTPVHLEEGLCRVEMTTTEAMQADASGLVHGGFIFGMADYAAMLAVNHPHVVLASADCRFLKPVRAGQRLKAEARITSAAGKRRQADVRVVCEGDPVFEGVFSCAVLDRHVIGG